MTLNSSRFAKELDPMKNAESNSAEPEIRKNLGRRFNDHDSSSTCAGAANTPASEEHTHEFAASLATSATMRSTESPATKSTRLDNRSSNMPPPVLEQQSLIESKLLPGDATTGATIYATENNSSSEHATTIDNGTTRENVGTALSFDRSGRIERIQYPGGRRLREFTYSGYTTVVASVVLIERDKPTRAYVRQAGDNWLVTDAAGKKLGTWRGQVEITPNGTYAVRQSRSDGNDDAAQWKTFRSDGTEAREFRGTDGARAIYEVDGRLCTLTRADGTSISAQYTDGRLSTIVESHSSSSEITWRRQSGGIWIGVDATSQEQLPLRKNITFGNRGDMQFVDEQGQKHTLRPDGSQEIKKTDLSFVEIDRHGIVRKTRTAYGDHRTFEYDETGAVTTITSVTKAGGKHIWNRRSGDEVTVTANGDITFRNPDGRVSIERSTFQRIDFDKDGHVEKVTNPDGSTSVPVPGTSIEMV